VDDAGAHEVVRVGVNVLQQLEAVTYQLRLGRVVIIDGAGTLEDLLTLLRG